jgi:hypothetical protein
VASQERDEQVVGAALEDEVQAEAVASDVRTARGDVTPAGQQPEDPLGVRRLFRYLPPGRRRHVSRPATRAVRT